MNLGSEEGSEMICSWRGWSWKLELATFLAMSGAITASGNCALAQITPDSTLGSNERSLVRPNVEIKGLPSDRIDGGAQRGANLFHSFQQFNVGENQRVYFANPTGVGNILSRVTGNDPSSILGTLGVTGGDANLFLMNPNGIFFGPSASLDVNGSFMATTASAVQFGSQGSFSASAPNAPSVLTVNPSALLFNQIAAQPINSIENRASLSVPNSQSLLLLGGDVSLNDGALFAPGGRVELGGVAGAGAVGLNVNDNNLSLNFPDQLVRADVSLTREAVVNVAAGDGGSITVTARNIDISGGSLLRGGLETNLGFLGAKAGDISLSATNAINVTNGFIFNNVRTGAIGNGGNIDITTGSLSVTNGAQLSSSTYGRGNAGNLTIEARRVRIQGEALPSQVIAATSGEGQAGNLLVTASESVELIGAAADGLISSGLGTPVLPEATGDGGNLTLETGRLIVRDGAQIGTATFGQGQAGNLLISARESVELIGESLNGRIGSSIATSVQPGAKGNGGNLILETGQLIIQDGAEISSGTLGKGNAGSLSLNATESVELIGTSAFDSKIGSSLSTSAKGGATGDGGNLTLETGRLIVRDGAAVNSQTGSTGNSGELRIATGQLLIQNGGQIRAGTRGGGQGRNLTVNATDSVDVIGTNGQGAQSGLFTTTDGEGDSGDVTITTRRLKILEGATVSASNLAIKSDREGNVFSGRGGNVFLNALSIEVAGTSVDNFRSSIVSETGRLNDVINLEAGIGRGGNLRIEAGQLNVRDEAEVSTATFGQGRSGNIQVQANSLTLINGGRITSRSEGQDNAGNAGNISIKRLDALQADNGEISASSAQAGGGKIDLTADDIRLRNSSPITTSVADGTGGGGNINIDTDLLVTLEDSDIRADAFKGRGGNVQIDTQGLFRSLNSDITASSELGIDGVVEINTPDTELQGSLTQLSANFISPEQVVTGSCLARRNVEQGSFVVTGTGGLPRSPYEAISGRYTVTGVQPIQGSDSVSQAANVVENAAWKKGDPIHEAQGMMVTADGRTIVGTNSQLVALAKVQNLVCYSN